MLTKRVRFQEIASEITTICRGLSHRASGTHLLQNEGSYSQYPPKHSRPHRCKDSLIRVPRAQRMPVDAQGAHRPFCGFKLPWHQSSIERSSSRNTKTYQTKHFQACKLVKHKDEPGKLTINFTNVLLLNVTIFDHFHHFSGFFFSFTKNQYARCQPIQTINT